VFGSQWQAYGRDSETRPSIFERRKPQHAMDRNAQRRLASLKDGEDPELDSLKSLRPLRFPMPYIMALSSLRITHAFHRATASKI